MPKLELGDHEERCVLPIDAPRMCDGDDRLGDGDSGHANPPHGDADPLERVVGVRDDFPTEPASTNARGGVGATRGEHVIGVAPA